MLNVLILKLDHSYVTECFFVCVPGLCNEVFLFLVDTQKVFSKEVWSLQFIGGGEDVYVQTHICIHREKK